MSLTRVARCDPQDQWLNARFAAQMLPKVVTEVDARDQPLSAPPILYLTMKAIQNASERRDLV